MASAVDTAAKVDRYFQWVAENKKRRLEQEATIQCTPAQQQSFLDSTRQVFDKERDTILTAVLKHIDDKFKELESREKQQQKKADEVINNSEKMHASILIGSSERKLSTPSSLPSTRS